MYGRIQQEKYHKMQKIIGAKTFSTWEKANTWALPHYYDHRPRSYRFYVPSSSYMNPWLSQTLVGDEPPSLKGDSTAISYISCSNPLRSAQLIKVNHKRKKAYKEGWENQSRGTSCTTIAPSYTLKTQSVVFPLISYPSTPACDPRLPLLIPYFIHLSLTCHHLLTGVP